MKRLFRFIVVIFFVSICFSLYADSVVGKVDRTTTTEKNGLTWTLLSTRYGTNETLTRGLEINGRTIVPLYKGLVYFSYKQIGNGGIFMAENLEMSGPHKKYIFYNLDGKIIFETDERYTYPYYDNEIGLYFKEDSKISYLSQKLDINGRVFSSSSPKYCVESTTVEKKPSDAVSSTIDNLGTQIVSSLNVQKNGFKWYKTKRGSTYGAISDGKKEILPPIFESIYFYEYSVGEEESEKEPFFQVELIKNGQRTYQAYSVDGKLSTYKRILRNVKGFKYYDVFNRGKNLWSIEDEKGNVIIPEDKYANTIFYYPSSYMGGFFQLTFMGGGLVAEIYNQAGNLIIPKSRKYWQIRLKNFDDKYFITQTSDGIGMCDLNGFEIVAPNYERIEYDGYDFKGTTKNGNVVNKSIHKRPTATQTQAIRDWGGYYSNMPWLMMPGPNYSPTFNINWNSQSFDWNTVGVYGGVGDYVSPETNLIDESTSSSSGGSISSHKCAFCNGTGKKEVNQSVATFGTTDVKVHCNECGRDFYRSSGHSHVQCGQCGGTGRAK